MIIFFVLVLHQCWLFVTIQTLFYLKDKQNWNINNTFCLVYCFFHCISRWLKNKYETPNVSQSVLVFLQFEKRKDSLACSLFKIAPTTKDFGWVSNFTVAKPAAKNQHFKRDQTQSAAIICLNDELSLRLSWLDCLLTHSEGFYLTCRN